MPHTPVIDAFNVIAALETLVKVVWLQVVQLRFTLPVGIADHVTDAPTGRLGIKYEFDELQKALSPEIAKPILPVYAAPTPTANHAFVTETS